MDNVIQYLLEASLVMAVLYGFYHLALRNDTFFKFNRVYLLGLMILSVSLPLLNFSISGLQNPANDLGNSIAAIQLPEVVIDGSKSKSMNWWQLGAMAYLVVTVFLIVRLAFRLGSVWQLRRKYHAEKRDGIVWINSEEPATFSFFNWLFLAPKHRGDKIVATTIINHEKAHIRQGHSWDVLVAELFTAAFWINPFAWFTNRAIRQNHEYLADEAALGSDDKANYARLIVHDASRQRQVMFGNHFSQFQIKRRLGMIYRSTSRKATVLKALLSIPLLAMLVLISCQQEQINDLQPAQTATVLQIDEVDKMPTYPGGMSSFYQDISDNLSFPKDLQATDNEGNVFLSFVINEKGQVTQTDVLKSLHPTLDELAKKALLSTGQWQPATKNGKPVSVKYNLPIKFSLE